MGMMKSLGNFLRKKKVTVMIVIGILGVLALIYRQREGFNLKKAIDPAKARADRRKKKDKKKKLQELLKAKKKRKVLRDRRTANANAFEFRDDVGELKARMNAVSNTLLIDLIEGNSSRFVDFYKQVFIILGDYDIENTNNVSDGKGPVENISAFFDDLERSAESKNEIFERLDNLVLTMEKSTDMEVDEDDFDEDDTMEVETDMMMDTATFV